MMLYIRILMRLLRGFGGFHAESADGCPDVLLLLLVLKGLRSSCLPHGHLNAVAYMLNIIWYAWCYA
jgi:hypothetical protein